MNKKIQVFVSSTYTDLKEERQAAVQAILDAGHIPAGMELFKAGNESQLKTIYKWIDESDVYMLILGGRYGSVEEKSGLSYTQLEYEYALNKNIPVFAFVLSESFLTSKITSLGLSSVMEQKSPDKYQTFKSLVMSKMIKEIDDCKDIKINIPLTIKELLNQYDLIGWTRNTFPISNMIIAQESKKFFKSINIILSHLLNGDYDDFSEQFNLFFENIDSLRIFYNNNKAELNFYEVELDSIIAFTKILAIKIDEIQKSKNSEMTQQDENYLFYVTNLINNTIVRLLNEFKKI